MSDDEQVGDFCDRRGETHQQPTADEQAETMAIDLSERLETVDPAGGSPEDGETIAIDIDRCFERRGTGEKREAADVSPPPPKMHHRRRSRADDEQGDGSGAALQVRPFPYERLERINEDQHRGIDALFDALQPGGSICSLTERLEQRMQQLLDLRHHVRFIGVNTVVASGRTFEFGDGIWTWGRMPPDHRRLVAGIHDSLAHRWLEAAHPGTDVRGDDFEFGVLTFLIAEFCAEVGNWAGWPPFCWAVNPMSRRDLKAMMLAEPSALLELGFAVAVHRRRGTVRIWLPANLVNRLAEQSPAPEIDGSAPQQHWWSMLPAGGPLVAGATELRCGEYTALAPGDIVVVERHGIAVEGLVESAHPAGASWRVGTQSSIIGQLVDGSDDGWCFEVLGKQPHKNPTGGDVSDTQNQANGDGESPQLSVGQARVQLEVHLGSIEMEMASLTRLKRGRIIDCARPLGSPVDLVVDGRRIGRGELVNVDGRLGVRVLSIQQSQ